MVWSMDPIWKKMFSCHSFAVCLLQTCETSIYNVKTSENAGERVLLCFMSLKQNLS